MIKLDNCLPCPTCHTHPTISHEDKLLGQPGQDVILRCAEHGHVAMGDTVDMAVKHWNIWITHVIRKAGQHYLANGAGKPTETYCTVCGEYTESVEFPDRVECKGVGAFKCTAVKHWKAA